MNIYKKIDIHNSKDINKFNSKVPAWRVAYEMHKCQLQVEVCL